MMYKSASHVGSISLLFVVCGWTFRWVEKMDSKVVKRDRLRLRELLEHYNHVSFELRSRLREHT